MTSNSDPNTGAKASSAALHGLRSSRRHDLPMTLSWLQDDLIGITRDAAATLLPELIVPTTGQDWRLFDHALARLAESGDEMDLELSAPGTETRARIRLSPQTGLAGGAGFMMTFDIAATAWLGLDLPKPGEGASDLGDASVALFMADEEKVQIALRALTRLCQWSEQKDHAEDMQDDAIESDRTWLAAHLARCTWSSCLSARDALSRGIERAGLPSLHSLGLGAASAKRHVTRDRTGGVLDVTYHMAQRVADPDAVWTGLEQSLGICPAGRRGDFELALNLTWWIDLAAHSADLVQTDRIVEAQAPKAVQVVLSPVDNARVPESPASCVTGRISLVMDLTLPHPACAAILECLSSGQIAAAREMAGEALDLEVVLAPPIFDFPQPMAHGERLVVAPVGGTQIVPPAQEQSAHHRTLRHGTALRRIGEPRYDAADREWVQIEAMDETGDWVSGWVASDDLRVLPATEAADDGHGRVNPRLEWQGLRRHRIAEGETLERVAKTYACSLGVLKTLNGRHLINPEILWPGDVVYVPSNGAESA
ncbi:MAG: LysM peptidoglycan-binding domain-containing protein [Pseudomonadota bacterium]